MKHHTASVLLLDIEGTTTPIDFVTRTLFPYARERMGAFCDAGLAHEDLAQLAREYEAETDPSRPAWAEPPTTFLLWLMSLDRKSRGLKSVQGKIWERGYLDGSLRGEVFDDVAPAMKRWVECRRPEGQCCIYSSGSVLAQQLLFRHSTAGDLTPLISGYFDTEVGPKREAGSYRAIAERLGVGAGGVLFVSDVPAECEAARAAGMQVLLAVRPGAAEYSGGLEAVRGFAELG